MPCKHLHDPDALEYETARVESELDFIDNSVVYQSPKYSREISYRDDCVAGTPIHGVF